MNKFTVHYPNGIKRHINRLELALLFSSLTQIGPREYRAESLQAEYRQVNEPNFLPGEFTVEFIDRSGSRGIRTERLETPGGMTARLIKQGIV